MAHDVFISYSSKDKLTADVVCGTLEKERIRCWIAPRDVVPGKEYAVAIVDAIAKCRALVLVFSSHSNESPQVKREVERAISKGIPVIPLRIQDVPMSKALEFYISDHHWLDALTPPLEAHLQKLAGTIRALLQSETARAEPPGTGGTVSSVMPSAAAQGSAESPPAKRWNRTHGTLSALLVLVTGGSATLLLQRERSRPKEAAPASSESVKASKPGKDFSVEITLNNSKGEYLEGEEVVFTVTASRDCFLYLYDEDPDNTASLLIPNELVPEVELKAGQSWDYPDEAARKRGIRLIYQLPEGQVVLARSLRVLASETPIPLKLMDPTRDGFSGVVERLTSARRLFTNAEKTYKFRRQ